MNPSKHSDISDLKPSPLWKHFSQICQIPHPSKKEAKLAKFVKEFGEDLKLETIMDEVGNVIIKKPATSGMENRKGVILQAHLDMVPQKNSGVAHDFEKDPIEAYIDGEWVTAKGTTLGADNGIGVATIMAVLQAQDIEHGPIEALFTVDEETGMTGAFALKEGVLTGEILLNLDSEDEGEFCIGCAGGITTDIELKYSEVAVPNDVVAFEIGVSGLKGGHSGVDINLGRGNANKILNRLLWQASKQFDLRVAEIDAGDLRNAIPREATAIVTVPKAKKTAFVKSVDEFAVTVKQEISAADPDVKITAKATAMPTALMDEKTQHNLLDAVYACVNGVIGMSTDMPDLIEASTNLARVHAEQGKMTALSLQRSAVESLKQDVANMVGCAFALIGAKVKQEGSYPGWKPDMDSTILAKCKALYAKEYGQEPKITAIHGGLECGLFMTVYPDLDMLSFGPTIKFPHSPDEKVNIASVTKFWNFLITVLANIDEIK